MAYNFPVGYQPYYPQAQQSSSIIWVQGEAGAKSYLVAPGNTVPLWDSEAQVIYLKTADVSGMPSMKVLDYTVRDAAPSVRVPVGSAYVTKEEFSAFRDEIRAELNKAKEGEE